MWRLGLGLMGGLILPNGPSTRQREAHEAWMKDYERMLWAGPGCAAPGDLAEVQNAYIWHGPLDLMGLRKIPWQERAWSWLVRFLGQGA